MGKRRSHEGYYRYATIFGDKIYFVCEDDLWTTSVNGGKATRLTTGQGESSLPRVSHDGSKLAFVGREEGHPEVFIIDSDGGLPKRLTYVGSDLLNTVGWSKDDRHVYFISDHHSPFFRASDAFAISAEGGSADCFGWGHVQSFDIAADGRVVLGRNNSDPARWKRYRGGTRGDIWVDDNGDGKFNRLIDLEGNLAWPMWIKNRIYFLSDHEGVGNIYSCTASGNDLKRHTNRTEYFVRFPSTDGKRICYTAGGDIFVYDPESDEDVRVDFQAPASTHQVHRKFVEYKNNLHHFSPHPEGQAVSLIVRGQPITMGNWEGPAIQHGLGSRVRYRLSAYMPDGESFVVVNDKDGFEKIELHSCDQSAEPQFLTEEDLGRILEVKVSYDGSKIALSNHRQELIVVDVKSKELKVVDKSPAERITDFNWSYDDRWLAYSYAGHPQLFNIRVAQISNGKIFDVTDPVRCDVAPSWDPDGNYLYFLGARDFYPVMDAMSFDYGFPRGFRPYLITLRKDLKSPFVKDPKPVVSKKASKKEELLKELVEADTEKSGKKKSTKDLKKAYKRALTQAYNEMVKELDGDSSGNKKAKEEAAPSPKSRKFDIDFDGISDRILAIPVGEGCYGDIIGVSGKVLFTVYPLKGIRPDHSWFDEDQHLASIVAYDFDEDRHAVVHRNVNEMKLAMDGQTLFYRSRKNIRAVDATEKLPAEGRSPSTPSSVGRDTGLLDLDRVHVLVNPQDEWAQMFDEAWRLQKEQFWDEKMSDIDWDLVYDRYARLLPRLRTRSEVSDLIWEMQGELGTSHAYEFGGDYRRAPSYRQGYLGADFKWDAKNKGYKIVKIYRGDSWQLRSSSPLTRPGIGIEEGDIVVAVNGVNLARDLTVSELLINQAGKEVILSIKGKGKSIVKKRVETLRHERALRYRDWVETNRKYVHEKTNGRIGYVHIPDMGPQGFAEFHRGYLGEIHREGLIVDVRYNRGGHVSSLLLEKLARRRVGYDISRWGPPQPYPQESVAGPMVALTNEFAGSDGDIFSHCFKLFELGPLVGKRTWGGVIGIWPRHRLVDKTLTTQPEFSFWFVDVGFGVENYGTDPDYEVDIAPHQFKKGEDPQMDKGLELIRKLSKDKPFKLPDFSKRPQLTLPVELVSKNGKNGAGPEKKSVKVQANAKAKAKTKAKVKQRSGKKRARKTRGK